MSKYIDAEWIRNVYVDFEHYENRDDWTTPIANVLAVIDDAPSIDIVRCGECKYWIDDRKAEEDMGTCGLTHYFTNADDFCSYGSRSEKPNNCEHITEDGVTCAKYPACDDCLENPLNKVKGSERLVKGSEVTTDCRQLERSRR